MTAVLAPNPWLIVVYLLSAVIAVVGVELTPAASQRPHPLTAIFKTLTTVLLFVLVGKPETRFQVIVEIGFLLSLVGDVALLFSPDRPDAAHVRSGKIAFGIGLVGFLFAHVSYIIAFTGVGSWSSRTPIVALVFAALTGILFALVWKGSGDKGVRPAVIVYGVAITTMVVTASMTLGGQLVWAMPAAIGAVLFYVSDSSLSLNAFRREIPHAQFLTMGVYWLGQLGIALAARA
ncbi:MAG: lysoplasmalogenase, partial [Bacteroidota bacterium]